ncbi:MAG: lysophospholipid acyltransferase family protein [Lautropia sp.]
MTTVVLWLRSLLFMVVQVVTVIPWAFVCLACAPLPQPTRYRITVMWPRAMIHAARWLCGIRWQLLGTENLPAGPAILLSKHQSTWETFYLVSVMPRQLTFVFKRELLYLPFFGWGIGLLDMIHIDRSQGRDAFESVVTQGVRQLAEGRWVIMFPEGTRIPPGRVGRYKSGGARLAIRTGTPVVPIAVNSGRLWPKGKFIKTPGLITVSIGAPIDPAGLAPEDLTARVEGWIESEMRRISPADYGNLQTSPGAKEVSV